MPSSNPLPGGVKAALYGLGLVGALGTWGRSAADGTLLKLLYALHGAEEYTLPGTQHTLRKTFTGLYWPVDYLLDVLVVFFWEAVDGSHPTTSAIGVYFLGQLFPILVAVYLNTVRGESKSLFRLTLWLLAFQMCALGCVGWVWALAFIGSSATTASGPSVSVESLRHASLLSRPRSTWLILAPLLLGYVAPAIAMALPSSSGLVTNSFQQAAVVVWNVYPLPVLALFQLFQALVPSGAAAVPSGQEHAASGPAAAKKEHLRVVRWASAIAIAISATMHVAVVAVSVSTVLFPALFNPQYAASLHPALLILPPLTITQAGFETVGDGVRSFLMWDQAAAYPTVLLVMLMQLRAASRATGATFSWTRATAAVLGIAFVAGPGTACLAVGWLRDETLFGATSAEEVGQSNSGKGKKKVAN